MREFNVTVLDNCVPDQLRQQVWDYLKTQTWHVYFRYNKKLNFFIPNEADYNHFNKNPSALMGGVMMPRCLLASDIVALQKHPLIVELWDHINTALGGDLTIEGLPEGCPACVHPDWVPTSSVDTLEPGWRVYTNLQPNETIKRSHGVHRDNKNLDDETSMTILFVVNPVWYPTWFAENVFYAEDPEGTTNDRQQYQGKVVTAQNRSFNVGWAKQIVSPLPGRIIAYDSRNLHSTRPSAEWAEDPRIVVAFRARRKT
jgi:hypothetical protein